MTSYTTNYSFRPRDCAWIAPQSHMKLDHKFLAIDRPDFEIFPGVVTDHRGNYPHMMCWMLEQINQRFGRYVTEGQLQDDKVIPGIPSKLLALGGYNMSPLGTMPPDNKTEEAKVLDEEDKLIYRGVCRLMMRHHSAANIPINDLSTCGFPDFTKHSKIKSDRFSNVLRNFHRVCDLVRLKDFTSLMTEFAIIAGATVTARIQADSSEITFTQSGQISSVTPKERTSFLPDGSTIVVDKKIKGTLFMQRKRLRVANAVSNLLNMIVQGVMAPIRRFYLREYDAMFHHGSYREMGPKIANLHKQIEEEYPGEEIFVFTSDNKNYDRSYYREFINIAIDELPVSNDVFRRLFSWMSNPFMCVGPDVMKSKFGVSILGDPFNWDWEALFRFPGNLSGTGSTSDIGKFGGVTNAAKTHVYILTEEKREFFFSSLKEYLRAPRGSYTEEMIDALPLHRFMKHRDTRYKEENQGDDSRKHIVGRMALEKVVALIASNKLPFKSEIDENGAFLGTAVHKDTRSHTVNVLPNINSLLVNNLTPERPITDKFRQFWPLGWKDTKRNYGDHPLYDEYISLIGEGFRKYFSINFEKELAIHINLAERRLALALGDQIPMPQNETDRIALANRDAIHYKISIEDLSDEVRKFLYGSYPWDEFSRVYYEHGFLIRDEFIEEGGVHEYQSGSSR